MYIKVLNKLKYLQTRYIHYNSKLLSPRPDHIIKTPLNRDISALYETHRNSILYSSYIEGTKLKLGYTRNKVVQNVLQQEEIHRLYENSRVKPFSLALKYIEGNDKEITSNADLNQEEPNINYEIKVRTKLTYDKKKEKLLKTFKNKSIKIKNNEEYPNNWMTDYEIYDDSDYECKSQYGSPDPTIPVSKIPCYGCGAYLHCADSSLPGYLPSELFRGKREDQLQSATCQRCHFLKNYNTAINVTVSSDDYIEMIKSISDKFALVILMVDLTDFPCSIWPGIADILGSKRPVFVVGNKVDLLPKDSRGYLNHIKKCLENSILESGIAQINIKHVCLISAQTGYGVEELITKLHNIWRYKGDVYLVGCTNVGKSSLFNALLRSDYCKVKASNIIRKATASQWPGTTLRMLKFPILRPSDNRLYIRTQRIMSESFKNAAEAQLRKDQAISTGKKKYATLIGHIGQTFADQPSEVNDAFSMGKTPPVLSLNENTKEYVASKWCFDTPGVVQPEQILNLLTTEELLLTIPKEIMTPRTFIMKPGMTLFLAAVGRLDYVNGTDPVRLTVYSSSALPILITKTDSAQIIYEHCLGTDILLVPKGDTERLKKWPPLKGKDLQSIKGEGERISAYDILLSSSGWIGVSLPTGAEGNFKAWTPDGRGIFVRQPSLIPYGVNLRGSRIRGSLAYKMGTAFIKT